MKCALALLTLLLCSACTGGGAQRQVTRDSVPVTRRASAEELLSEYLAAVSAGDAQKAMSLRCQPARWTGDDLKLWTDQAARLVADTGPLAPGAVRLMRLGDGPLPAGGLHALAHVAFRIRVHGALSDREQYTVPTLWLCNPRC